MTDSVFDKQNQAQQRLESLSKAVGFDIPVESVTLPSKGLVYPPEHALHRKSEVEIKCMTAKEEDILTSRALLKNGTMVSELLRSCLIDKSVDVDSLLTGDRNALLIALRVSGYGPEYTVTIECPACEESFDNLFSLAQLKVKELSKAPAVEFTNLFSFTLPRTCLEVKYKLLTGRDDQELSRSSDRSKKLGTQIDNKITSRLLSCIVSIGDVTDRAQIARKLQNLIAFDSLALRKEIDRVEPEVDMRQNVTCKLCGESSVVKVPLDASFFWPDINT